MLDHTLARRPVLLVAASLFLACHDEPTLPRSGISPLASAASIAPPAGTTPFYEQGIWRIVDENDNEIWQNVNDAPLSGGYFTLATAAPNGQLIPCGQLSEVVLIMQCLGGNEGWSETVFGLAGDPSCGLEDGKYPVAMWVWSGSPCPAPSYWSAQYDHFDMPAGARVQATAALTAPGGLVFKSWEIRIQGTVLPCAEGAASPTCTVTATQYYDNSSGGLTYKLVYGAQFPFTGFLSPVDNAPTVNVGKAGSAIPVKFSLGGDRGLGILATGSPASAQVACDLSAASDDVETTVSAGGSSLTYDATVDQYSYIWKTDKAWAGTCRELRLTLTDGSVHVAEFKFKK